jgi:aliphatic nitrilase
VVFDPAGKPIGDSLSRDEGILYADIDLAQSVELKQFHDPVGYYNRFDIFALSVNRSPHRPAKFVEAPGDGACPQTPPDADSLSRNLSSGAE